MLGQAHSADPVTIRTLDGQSRRAVWLGLDTEQLRVQKPDGMGFDSIPLASLQEILISPALAAPRETTYDRIELVDGSTLLLSKVLFRGKDCIPTLLSPPEGQSVATPEVTLPLAVVSSWQRNAMLADWNANWQKLKSQKTKSDVVVLRQADGYNALRGQLGSPSQTGDQFPFQQEDGSKLNLRLSRITGGLLFAQPTRAFTVPTLCYAEDLLGNRWVVTQLMLTPSPERVRCQLTTVCGAQIDYPDVRALTKLDFARGNIQPLSQLTAKIELPPAEDVLAMGPEFGFSRQVWFDQAAPKRDLVWQGKTYRSGLSVPAGASLSYALDGRYRELKFLVGQYPANSPARPDLRLELDQQLVWELPGSAPWPPGEITLNLQDARELRWIVAPGRYRTGRILLLEARLQK